MFEPVKNCFTVCYRLEGLMDISPFGFKEMVWGLISPVQVLNVEAPDVGFKHFAAHGEA